jgi:spore cortex formation protein SpoVR/YcgB (stage V sporulation)
VQIYSIDRRGDRSLTLRHQQHDRKPLGESTDEVLKHLHRLWGFDIKLETLQGDQIMKTHHVPPRHEHAEGDYGRLDLAVVHL